MLSGGQTPASRAMMRRVSLGEQFFLEALGAEGLTAPPAARVTDDFVIPMIERDRGSIGFDQETLAHERGWGAVAVAVEVEAKVLLHEGFDGVAVIGSKDGQAAQTIRTKAVAGALASFAVEALISDVLQPLPHLAIDIGEVGKLPQRPEVLTDITDTSTFHLAFFPAGGGVAGSRVEVTLTGEGQEARMEADQGTVVLRHGGRQVVVPTFTSGAAQGLKGMEVTTGEGLEALAVSELDIEQATVTFDQAKGIELALVTLVVEGAEMAPIDLEALPGGRLHAHEGSAGVQRGPPLADVSPQDGDAALVAQRTQALEDDHGTGVRVLFQEVGDGGLEGIELTGSRVANGPRHRRVQVLADGFPGQMEVACHLTQGPMLFVVEAVDFVKTINIEHGSFVGEGGGEHQRDVLFKGPPAVPSRRQRSEESALGKKLSCSLQEARPPVPIAKPRRQNVLGPELSCSLQDAASGAAGPADADLAGYAGQTRGGSAGTGGDNRDGGRAICADCPGRPDGTRGRLRSSGGGTRAGAAADNRGDRKPVAEDEKGKAETAGDNNGSGDRSWDGSGSGCEPFIVSASRPRSEIAWKIPKM